MNNHYHFVNDSERTSIVYTHYLKQTMENFYLCTHIPVRALDAHYKDLLYTGLLPGMLNFNEPIQNWLEHLSVGASSNLFTFSPCEHIHFTLCKMHPPKEGIEPSSLETSIYNGFFLIGPYTDSLTLKEDYAFKPLHCIPHLIELLHIISKTQLSQITHTALEDYNYHVARAKDYIKMHYMNPITLDGLATHLGLNKSYLCTIFKKSTKDSFCNYTNKIRIEESKKLLKTSSASMTDIALAVGFSSSSYFNTIFKKLEGKTPLDYRKESLKFKYV